MELYNWFDITILEEAICSDHVHMYFSALPPKKFSPALLMKILKGKSAKRLSESSRSHAGNIGGCISLGARASYKHRRHR